MSKKDDRLNDVRYNNDGEEMRIVRYGNVHDIDVQFDDGTIVEHRYYSAFKKGEIKNPMTPSVYGVGFIGKGRFKPYDKNGKPTRCYTTWKNMLKRSYCPKYQEKEPTYIGCTVCEEWHNFQVFAEWYYEYYYEFEGQRIHLDKDILNKGNKLYSPQNCIFVPQFINSLFIKHDRVRGEYPIGVRKVRDKYVAQLSKDKKDKTINLGTYDTPEEAFQVYKQAKEEYIKKVAEEYKGKIPQKLYDAMMNYEVEITD